MPVIPIIGAGIALASGGAAAIGGVIAGTATLATAFEAAATVGAVLGAVGAVTHDKTLSMVGTVIGGVGGIGALASSAGLFGAEATTENIFGGSMPAAADAAAGSAGSSLVNGASTGAATSTVSDVSSAAGGDFIDTFARHESFVSPDFAPATNFGTAAQDIAAQAHTASSSASSVAEGAALAPGKTAAVDKTPASSITGAPTSVSTTDTAWLKQQYPNPMDGMTAKNAATGNAFTYSTASGWQPVDNSGIFGFLKSSGGGAIGMGVVQAAGSFLQGAFDPLKPAQASAYNAQAASNQAAANLSAKQLANISSGVPAAKRVAPPPAPVTGIINTTPGA